MEICIVHVYGYKDNHKDCEIQDCPLISSYDSLEKVVAVPDMYVWERGRRGKKRGRRRVGGEVGRRERGGGGATYLLPCPLRTVADPRVGCVSILCAVYHTHGPPH